MRLTGRGLQQSLQHRKTLFYVISSLLLGMVLLITGVLDLIFLLVVERPDLTTHKALATIMVLHVVTFYLALFGFIHSLESQFYTFSKMAFLAGGMCLTSLLIRSVQELMFAGLYPSSYAVT